MNKIMLILLCGFFLQQNALAGLAYGTKIQSSSGMVAVETLALGDLVETRKGPQRVVFSSGTGPNAEQTMLHLTLGNGENIIVGLDQPFLSSASVFIKARNLRAGDSLAAVTGGAVSVNAIALGSFKGGVHLFATVTTNLNALDPMEHTFMSNGLFLGDYTIQLMLSRQEPAPL